MASEAEKAQRRNRKTARRRSRVAKERERERRAEAGRIAAAAEQARMLRKRGA